MYEYDYYHWTSVWFCRPWNRGKVAEYFGIKCYDKELLTRAAQESGFCEEMIQNHDERPTNSFLYNLVMDTYSFGYNASSFVDMPISHKVFLAQFDTIKKIADEGPCVIVGRCADYALADYKTASICSSSAMTMWRPNVSWPDMICGSQGKGNDHEEG